LRTNSTITEKAVTHIITTLLSNEFNPNNDTSTTELIVMLHGYDNGTHYYMLVNLAESFTIQKRKMIPTGQGTCPKENPLPAMWEEDNEDHS